MHRVGGVACQHEQIPAVAASGVVGVLANPARRDHLDDMAIEILGPGVNRVQLFCSDLLVLRHVGVDAARDRVRLHAFRPVHRGGAKGIGSKTGFQ